MPLMTPAASEPRSTAAASHGGALRRAIAFVVVGASLALPMALSGRAADEEPRLSGYPRLDLVAQSSPFGAGAPLTRPAKTCSADF